MVKYNREQIALDLLLCSTNADVCKKNNISEATLYRIKKEATFNEILNKQKHVLFGETMRKAQAYSLGAVEVLREVANDKEAPQSSRVSAASKLIELGQAMFDQEQIVERINELESRLLDET